MKKLITIMLMILSLNILANDDVVIDKQITGVNLDQLEIYDIKNDVKLDKDVIEIEDKNITTNRYKNQNEIIDIRDDKNSNYGSLTETDSVFSKKKIIIGIAAVILLGIVL